MFDKIDQPQTLKTKTTTNMARARIHIYNKYKYYLSNSWVIHNCWATVKDFHSQASLPSKEDRVMAKAWRAHMGKL